MPENIKIPTFYDRTCENFAVAKTYGKGAMNYNIDNTLHKDPIILYNIFLH